MWLPGVLSNLSGSVNPWLLMNLGNKASVVPVKST